MLTCRDATRLASEALDRRLTLRERVGLNVHLALCGLCRRYAAQIDFVRRAVARLAARSGDLGAGLSAVGRDRIRRRLTDGRVVDNQKPTGD
ncbi:MAG TPA: zf-HC2 domain-containing protein [Gammaproteobacteria bacterium]|nr:zf-HC2 domain-containing protein [Gammaproteobacteria bacterium]